MTGERDQTDELSKLLAEEFRAIDGIYEAAHSQLPLDKYRGTMYFSDGKNATISLKRLLQITEERGAIRGLLAVMGGIEGMTPEEIAKGEIRNSRLLRDPNSIISRY